VCWPHNLDTGAALTGPCVSWRQPYDLVANLHRMRLQTVIRQAVDLHRSTRDRGKATQTQTAGEPEALWVWLLLLARTCIDGRHAWTPAPASNTHNVNTGSRPYEVAIGGGRSVTQSKVRRPAPPGSH
jgi:hypothetical protein